MCIRDRNGALLIVVADDPNTHSSQNEQDTRVLAEFAKVPLLEPSDVEEAAKMAYWGMKISEMFKIPVILRTVTRLSHSRSNIEVEEIKIDRKQGKFKKNVERWVAVPKHARKLHIELLEKYERIRSFFENSNFNNVKINDCDIGIVTSGVPYWYVAECSEILSLNPSFFKIGAYPLPEESLKRYMENVKSILVVEELEDVIEKHVRILAQKCGYSGKIYGKDVIPRGGEVDVENIKKAFSHIKEIKVEVFKKFDSVERAPVLCPGCPHRATFYLLKRVFGNSAVYSGDIGCYTLGFTTGTIDTTICMGASIGIANGLYHAGENVIAVIGDSTFYHAGIPALINAVHNRAEIVVVILDNGTVAMTGGQPTPENGIDVMGRKVGKVKIEDVVNGCGVDLAVVIDPYNIEESMRKLKKVKEGSGVRVVISRRPCVLKLRAFEQYKVNENCRGCRKCLELGCPAIEFNAIAKITSVCTGCGVCAQICPFNAIEVLK